MSNGRNKKGMGMTNAEKATYIEINDLVQRIASLQARALSTQEAGYALLGDTAAHLAAARATLTCAAQSFEKKLAA